MSMLKLVEEHRYEELFDAELFWDPGDYAKPLEVSVEDEAGVSQAFSLENVATCRGIRVFVCAQLPSRTVQAKIATSVGQKSTHYFLIFHDGGAHQTWRWPAQVLRGDKASIKLTSHEHVRGLQNPKLLKRLESIRVTPGESLSVTQMYDRIQAAFETETADETKKASTLMVDLFEALQKAGMKENHISETLARILFVMFGDDTEMWGIGSVCLFENYILEQTAEDGSDLAVKLNELFEFLDTKPARDGALAAEGKPEFAGFKYVNGGIFSNLKPLPGTVGKDFREAILRASRTDWSDISPAIFGSMFQSVRDAKTRRAMGEHYTSEKDILKTLNPLFLEELREVFHNARDKSDEAKRLTNLRKRIAKIKFMDPACGCGNFVIIAYRELRALETAIVSRLVEIGKISAFNAGFVLDVATQQSEKERALAYEPMVVIDNFYGIEIDPWPAAIARTAMFLIERQSDQLLAEKFGFVPTRLPIRQESHIVNADALLVDWREVLSASAEDEVYIAGNPPFLGHKERQKLSDSLFKAWGTSKVGHLDYSTGWYIKAARFLSRSNKFAFVSTNSVTQGMSVDKLFDPLYELGWNIDFAYRSFPWSGGAKVSCVIIGFSKGKKKKRKLFWSDERLTEVPGIIDYLLPMPPAVRVKDRTKILSPELKKMVMGSTPLSDSLKYKLKGSEDYNNEVEKDPILLKYRKQYSGSEEFIHNVVENYCFWMDSMPKQEELDKSSILRTIIEETRKNRLLSTRKATLRASETPYAFGENRRPSNDYLAIPQTFSQNRDYMTVGYLDKNIIPSAKLFYIDGESIFDFAILSSSATLQWQIAIGGRMRDDHSFAAKVVWNTLPLPKISEELREQIVEAGRGVLAAREEINKTAGKTVSLAEMYKADAMPEVLVKAHHELDKLVDLAFGAKEPLKSNEERLKLLFEQYAKMIAEEEAPASAQKKPTRSQKK
ncbi:class I SAM-dependent DNA methyltransferase [Rothia sp. 11254D007CT]